MILQRALRLHVGRTDELKESNKVFKRLKSVCGDIVNSKKLTEAEIMKRGYDTSFVTQVDSFFSGQYI